MHPFYCMGSINAQKCGDGKRMVYICTCINCLVQDICHVFIQQLTLTKHYNNSLRGPYISQTFYKTHFYARLITSFLQWTSMLPVLRPILQYIKESFQLYICFSVGFSNILNFVIYSLAANVLARLYFSFFFSFFLLLAAISVISI